jgi:hypothetical protein
LAAIVAVAALTAACDGGMGITTTTTFNTDAGTISGAVTADGVARSGVQVVAVGAAQRDSATTDGSGTYRISGLAAGTYAVSVQVPIGFTLSAGQSGTQNVTVATGGVSSANFALSRS